MNEDSKLTDIEARFEEVTTNKSYETGELLEYPQDLRDAAHAHADNHENVIYFYNAHKNVQEAGNEERAEAESRFEDCGGVGDDAEAHGGTYDRTAQLLSYHLEESRFTELVQGELETLRDELDILKDETDDAIEENETPDDLEGLENLAAKIETALEAIDTIEG